MRTRNNRLAAKRTVLSVLQEDEEVVDPNIMLPPSSSDDNDILTSKGFVLPEEISIDNGPNSKESIRLLIDDIEKEVKKRQDAICLQAEEAVTEQKQIAYLRSIKLAKSVRKMTIREYNKLHGVDILEAFRKFDMDLDKEDSESCAAGKKRVRPVGVGGIASSSASSTMNDDRMCLQTPARSIRTGHNATTPGTAIRTVKKGELAFSKNGSPMDIAEEGDLVATVSKKRRGNDKKNMSAAFDINIGEGRYINLSNPGSTDDLTKEMKDKAMIQLKVMQEQMESLMAQLGN